MSTRRNHEELLAPGSGSRGASSGSRRGFTLMEALVTVVIITVIVLITLPAFNAMLYSSEHSLSENQLRLAMRGARDAAVRSGGDRDAALVFFYEPTTQKTSLVTCVKVGAIRDSADPSNPGATDYVMRDIFVPAADAQVVTLPKGWMVRGFVPPGFISGAGGGAAGDGWYSGPHYDAGEPNWVFPENGFYDPDADDAGMNRHTFMVRFEAGSGVMKTGDWAPALVLSPSIDDDWRTSVLSAIGAQERRSYDLSEVGDMAVYVARVLSASPNVITLADKRRLVGRVSTDMVMARPVSQIALYDERRLAQAIGARLQRDNNSLYKAPGYMARDQSDIGGMEYSNEPEMYRGANGSGPTINVMSDRVRRWIEGDTNGDGSVSLLDDESDGADRPEARVFTIDRYTGALQEVEVQK